MMKILYIRLCASLLYICVVRYSTSDILISELNASDPFHTNQQEFLELVNTNATSQSLEDYYLVYYNGETNPPEAYEVIDLSGYCIDGYGTLVLGRTDVTPTPDIIVPNIQDGRDTDGDAIVLYYNTVPGSDAMDMPLTLDGLVDFIVYTRKDMPASGNYFYPTLVDSIYTYKWENAEVLPEDESITRCSLSDDFLSFPLMSPSPGVVSPCLKTIIEDVYSPVHFCDGSTQPPSLTSTTTLPSTTKQPFQCYNSGRPWDHLFDFWNGMQSGGAAFIQVHARSKAECTMYCTQNDVCVILNFHRNMTDENCFLFSSDIGVTAHPECDVGKKRIC